MAAVDYFTGTHDPILMADVDYDPFDQLYPLDSSNYINIVLDEGPTTNYLMGRNSPMMPDIRGGGSCSGGRQNSQQLENSVEGGGSTRVAFRTKSEVEILDDGFKWRKYGKKLVKNSPNPRNYYRCSTEGCSVKKRIERDREDSNYVITTYDGVHNHTSADVIYYATQDDISGQFVVSGCYANGNILPNS